MAKVGKPAPSVSQKTYKKGFARCGTLHLHLLHRKTAVDLRIRSRFFMGGTGMTEKSNKNQLLEQKKTVLDMIAEGPKLSGEAEEKETDCYALDTERGAQLYASFSDDELLELLRESAKHLGRSPSQWEVHWLLRTYLKTRFKNWPGALRAAGLSRSAGRGGISTEQMSRKNEEYQRMLEQVRRMAEQLGRIPHPSELPEICQKLNKRYQTWGEVLVAAGVEEAVAARLQKEEALKDDELHMLQEVRALAERLNRAPLRREVEQKLQESLLRRFGSWRNVLYQIDLEPVRRITPFVNAPLQKEKGKRRATHRQELYDCHYRLLRLDLQTQADLDLVWKLAQQLGHPPGRREVPAEVRVRLQNVCGSWSNALFQLNLQEK